MDPRFRTTYIDPHKVEQVKKRAVAEAELMSLPVPANYCTPQQPGPALQVGQEDAQPPPKKKMTLAAFFKKNAPVSSTHQSDAVKIETELTTYLLTPEVDPHTDSLEWWKRHQQNFPRLSSLVKKIPLGPSNECALREGFQCGGRHCYMPPCRARGSRQACLPD